MRFLRLILGFAPWLALLVLAHGGLAGLRWGLLVGLALSLTMGLARLQRGLTLWTGLGFFCLASLAVVGFHNLWIARHMAILAPAALAVGTWSTLAAGHPFTLEYAREQTDPSLWNHPEFLRLNRLLTAAWGITFSLNALLGLGKLQRLLLPPLGYELMTYSLMLAHGSPAGIQTSCGAAARGGLEWASSVEATSSRLRRPSGRAMGERTWGMVIPAESLATARTWIRQELQIRQLPSLPEEIEENLFLQGRGAWTFRYSIQTVTTAAEGWNLQLEVMALLKKEFRAHLEPSRYTYRVNCYLSRADDSLSALTIRPTNEMGPLT